MGCYIPKKAIACLHFCQ